MKLTIDVPDEALKKLAKNPSKYMGAFLYAFGQAILAELANHGLLNLGDSQDD